MSEPVAMLVPQMNPNDEHAVIVAGTSRRAPRRGWSSVVDARDDQGDLRRPCASGGFSFYDAAAEDAGGRRRAPCVDRADRPDAQTPQPVSHGAEHRGPPATATRFTRKALRLMRELGLTAADFPGEGRIDVARRASARRAGRAAPAGRVVAAAGRGTPSRSSNRIEDRGGAGLTRRVSQPSSRARCRHVVVPACRARYGSSCARRRARSACSSSRSTKSPRLLADYPDLNGFFADGRAWRYRDSRHRLRGQSRAGG